MQNRFSIHIPENSPFLWYWTVYFSIQGSFKKNTLRLVVLFNVIKFLAQANLQHTRKVQNSKWPLLCEARHFRGLTQQVGQHMLDGFRGVIISTLYRGVMFSKLCFTNKVMGGDVAPTVSLLLVFILTLNATLTGSPGQPSSGSSISGATGRNMSALPSSSSSSELRNAWIGSTVVTSTSMSSSFAPVKNRNWSSENKH